MRSNSNVTACLTQKDRRAHNLETALRLAAAGIFIFPSDGKIPLVPVWQKADSAIAEDERKAVVDKFKSEHQGRKPLHLGSTVDASVIKRLWKECPDAVASISCGPSNLIVLDADSKNNGPSLLNDWFTSNGGWPSGAPTTDTQSGGKHVYFMNDPEAPLGCTAGHFRNLGTDVKGQGGQVIAPGAIRSDGRRYTPVDGAPDLVEAYRAGSLPMAPAAVKAAIGARRESNVSSIDEAREIKRLQSSDWPTFENNDDAALWGYDFDALQRVDEAFANLLREPSNDRSANRFALASILHRAYGSHFGVTDYAAILEFLNAETGGAFGEYVENAPRQGEFDVRAIAREFLKAKPPQTSDGSAYGAVDDADEPAGVVPPKARKLSFEMFDDAARTALDDTVLPLVEGLLDDGAMSVVYGESNAGKSFVALDTAFHVATGRDWNARRTKRGLVVYVAAEGGKRFKMRLAALRAHYGEEANGASLALVRSPIDLRDKKGDTREIINLIRDAEITTGERCALIVIDTLSRAMAGGDENSSVDMGALVSHCDKIRASTGAHLMLVHHSGKDRARGARGHSLLRAATDSEIEIIDSQIVTRKQRDMEFASAIPFALHKVDLGVDRNGSEQSSAVVALGVKGAVRRDIKLTPGEREFLEAVEKLSTDQTAVPMFEVKKALDAVRASCGEKEMAAGRLRTLRSALQAKGILAVDTDSGLVRLAVRDAPSDGFATAEGCDDEGA